MKTFFAIFAIFLSFLPVPGKAQEILVTSGEHSDFTRIVFRIPNGATWSLDSQRGRATIVLDGHEEGFNVDRVFSRIPRSRISDLTAEENTLTFELTCDCPVVPFVTDGDYLALDFQSGPPLPEDFSALPRALSQGDLPISTFGIGDLLWSVEQEIVTLGEETASSVEISPTEEANLLQESDRLSEAQRNLQESFAEAATRGVLQLSDGFPAALPDERAETALPEESAELFDSSENLDASESVLTSNMRITSSLDAPDSKTSAHVTSSKCQNDFDLNVSSWVKMDGPFAEIGMLRASLFDAVDEIDKETALDLARMYLHHGFGPEAKQVLELSVDLASEHPELYDIADILELGYARNPRALHTSLDCETSAALWSVLSAQTLPKREKVAVDAVLRALNGLPNQLRQFLAPTVSSRLLDYGEANAAEQALRTVQRTPGPNSDPAKLANADLLISLGETSSGTEQLVRLVEEGSPTSPSALVALMEAKLENDELVSPEIALTIEAYAFELSGSEMEKPLLRAHIIAAAKSGQFSKAFFELNENWPQVAERSENSELQSIVVDELTKRSDEMTFVSTVFSDAALWSPNMDRETWISVVKRLAKIGFPEKALEVVVSKFGSSLDSELQVLLAETNLEMGNYDIALQQVFSRTDPRADSIRARAQEGLGRNEVAHMIFSASGEDQAALRNARLSQNWNEIIADDDPVFGAVKKMNRKALPSTNPEPDMLENLTSLVGESESARNTISDLLKGTTLEN